MASLKSTSGLSDVGMTSVTTIRAPIRAGSARERPVGALPHRRPGCAGQPRLTEYVVATVWLSPGATRVALSFTLAVSTHTKPGQASSGTSESPFTVSAHGFHTTVFRELSLIHISEPTRLGMISYAV